MNLCRPFIIIQGDILVKVFMTSTLKYFINKDMFVKHEYMNHRVKISSVKAV